MTDKPNILIIGALCLFVGAVVWVSGLVSSGPSEHWNDVEVERSATFLRESGTLEAKELARIQTGFSDGTVTELHPDGSPVSKGQIIMKFDEEELQMQLEGQLEDLEQQQEDYESQLAEYAVLTNSFAIQTRLKVAQMRHARLQLDKGTIPLEPEEQDLMEIDVTLAALDLEEKQAELSRQEELVKRNFAPPSSLDRIRLERATARTFLEEKQSQLEIASQPVTEEERLTLQADLDKAEKEVNRNEEKQALQLRIQELELERIRLDIKHKKEGIDRRRESLSQVEIASPVGGIIRFYRDYSWSSKTWHPLSVGKRIRGRDMVATVVDPAQLSIRIMLHESDFPKVHTGQPVKAFLTAYPNEELTGTVTSVSEVGQDRDDLSPLYLQSPPIGQSLFLARVTLDTVDTRAMPGMTAHLQIQTAPPAEKLIIPHSALLGDAPPYQVIRRREGNVETIDVKGFFGPEGRFEVTHGLEPGDSVKDITRESP